MIWILKQAMPTVVNSTRLQTRPREAFYRSITISSAWQPLMRQLIHPRRRGPKAMDPALAAQIAPYEPWLIIAGIFVFFILLRVTRQELRKRVDEIGYRLLGNKGLLVWFWMNAPGVILHELSHAFVVLLFRPFGFRITSIALFRIKPMVQRGPNGRVMKNTGRQSLQLGEVQYVRPQGRFVTLVGDGLSATAPLFGGIAMVVFLYWVATGYNLWDIHLQ